VADVRSALRYWPVLVGLGAGLSGLVILRYLVVAAPETARRADALRRGDQPLDPLATAVTGWQWIAVVAVVGSVALVVAGLRRPAVRTRRADRTPERDEGTPAGDAGVPTPGPGVAVFVGYAVLAGGCLLQCWPPGQPGPVDGHRPPSLAPLRAAVLAEAVLLTVIVVAIALVLRTRRPSGPGAIGLALSTPVLPLLVGVFPALTVLLISERVPARRAVLMGIGSTLGALVVAVVVLCGAAVALPDYSALPTVALILAWAGVGVATAVAVAGRARLFATP
jgi:hypothetical protein